MEPTEYRKLDPIWASAAFHALLVALLYFLIFYGREPDVNQNGDKFQIDAVTTKQRSSRRATAKRSTVNSTRSKGVSLNDLGMRLNTQPIDQNSSSAETTTRSTSDILGDEDEDILNPDPRLARFNQYVYNKVQGWLDRDAYMNPATLTGTVKLKIWFDGDGNYLEKETLFEAIDPDFQAIVARALRKAFIEPIPKPFVLSKNKFFIIRTVYVRH